MEWILSEQWSMGSDEGVVMVLFSGAVKALVRAVAIRAAMLSCVSYKGLSHDGVQSQKGRFPLCDHSYLPLT